MNGFVKIHVCDLLYKGTIHVGEFMVFKECGYGYNVALYSLQQMKYITFINTAFDAANLSSHILPAIEFNVERMCIIDNIFNLGCILWKQGPYVFCFVLPPSFVGWGTDSDETFVHISCENKGIFNQGMCESISYFVQITSEAASLFNWIRHQNEDQCVIRKHHVSVLKLESVIYTSLLFG